MTGQKFKTPPSKITLGMVAEKAGVGPATVDRVINERGNVSKAAQKKVIEAARQLGLKRILPKSYHRHIRIEIILARPELPLIARISDEMINVARGLTGSVTIHRNILKEETPEQISSALVKTTCDGVIVYAPNHALVNSAISMLKKRGVHVVAIISDLPHSGRLAYAGMNHHQAGRTAGYLMHNTVHRPGPIVILCNHLGFQSHIQRVEGFSNYLKENNKNLTITAIVEGGDDRDRSEIKLRETFSRQKDIVGIYNVGAANRGVAAAIRADILAERPVFIGHELTPFTASFLREKTMSFTIDQAPELQARFAIEVLLREFGFMASGTPSPPYHSPVPIIIYSPENIPGSAEPN
ncbi:LacI family DNA-binding transcriptional regulator [Acidocella sp.]|uniref:LacI family DNA-binding transcriptional regulator n=1 Tax=Acidocella sp. TaxID=50710 RepID=UPI0026288C1C|nr:LacI family DNA-binding transcriptional regulator [Acidocella sp.]